MYSKRLLCTVGFFLISNVVIANGKPTEKDARLAIAKVFDQMIENVLGTEGFKNARLAPELHSTKIIACSKAQNNNGFNCDIEVDSTVALMGRQTQIAPFRLVNSDSGWVAISQ